MSEDADTIQVGIPKPRMRRAAIYMPAVAWELVNATLKLSYSERLHTVDGKSLDQRPDHHDGGATENRPTPPELVVDNTDKWKGENSAEGVRSADDSLQ